MSRLLVAWHTGIDPGGNLGAPGIDISGRRQGACSASRNTPVTDRPKNQLVFSQMAQNGGVAHAASRPELGCQTVLHQCAVSEIQTSRGCMPSWIDISLSRQEGIGMARSASLAILC